jgi:DNA mismatch repair ATPase MutS
LLTGPNRGGKSSFLRSFLLCIYLSQVFGLSFSPNMSIYPFDWISTGLRIEDRPGSASLFENELNFACEILKRSKREPNGLVLFDELFHSTNPPDGEKTAQQFLNKLWKTPSVVSIISTHVFSLVERSPSTISRLCVPAYIDESTNELVFTYKLTSGICKVSSVDVLLKKVGLLS